MNIVEWTDANFTDDTRLQRPTIINSSFAQLNRLYVKRQNLFFTQCLKHMKEHHRSWTVFIDTDEYLTMNQHVVPNAQTRLGAGHGSIAQILNQLQDDQLRRQHQLPFVGMHHLRKSCLTFWRRRYNALESNHHDNDDDNNNNHTATTSLVQQLGMNINQFLTLRFLRLALEPNQSEGAVKSMIDASVIPDCLLRWNTYHGSPHRPIARICPNIAKGYDKFPLGIHHYVGSLESYLYRDDSRVAKARNPTKWRQDALRDTGHVVDEITTWLHGFVNWVGFHEARRLLDGAGVLDYSWKERNMEYAKVFFPHNITAA